jgi:hypothetical protein
MSPANGHAKTAASGQSLNGGSALPTPAPGIATESRFAPQKIKWFVELLETPFDLNVIEWRVTNTAKVGGQLRGQVVPYADPRAYTDRLNELFTPAGWTRRYAVHNSPNFERSEDQRMVAKVFVTCELTIFGLGSHSATGEEWADDANAGTSAEAQAFKRTCSCFGLGRYLYYFSGVWIDLDERKRPVSKPVLAGWATPQGWRQGLRPAQAVEQHSSGLAEKTKSESRQNCGTSKASPGIRAELVRQIEALAEPLGKGLYRGLLKTIALVWNPGEIQDIALLEKVLKHMQSAERGLCRLRAALEHTGPESLRLILRSLNLKSIDRVNDLATLHDIVVALEARAGANREHA